jgi:hypothetical protein
VDEGNTASKAAQEFRKSMEVIVSRQILRSSVSWSAVVLALSACGAPASVTSSPEPSGSASKALASADPSANQALVTLRQGTARFHRFEDAIAAGYSTRVTPCWTHHSAGAMGYHYGKLDLFDATVDLLAPEVLMYEPQAAGQMKLVGMEYIVPIEAWTAAGHNAADQNDRPQLLGQKFTQHSKLPIYKLHIWLWRDNPQGTFADWNPKVSCDQAAETETF